MRLTSIEFPFDPYNIYRDGPRGVGYPADARSVGDSHPFCYCLRLEWLLMFYELRFRNEQALLYYFYFVFIVVRKLQIPKIVRFLAHPVLLPIVA